MQNAIAVDEVLGLIGDRQLAELIDLAERDNAKLVLVGDPHQLQPIEAGAPLRTLGDHIGKVVMSENVRQVAAWERAADFQAAWAAAPATARNQFFAEVLNSNGVT